MISQTINGLERRMYFRPAYHKVNNDPAKDYGVHSMEINFVLIGPNGAIHFTNFSGMMLDKTWEWWDKTGRMSHAYKMHMGADVGYHTAKPQFKSQEIRWPTRMVKKEGFDIIKASKEAALADTHKETGERLEEIVNNISWEKIGDAPPVCEYLGVPCYCDGSALKAEEWHNIWLTEGDDVIWEMMEKEYSNLSV